MSAGAGPWKSRDALRPFTLCSLDAGCGPCRGAVEPLALVPAVPASQSPSNASRRPPPWCAQGPTDASALSGSCLSGDWPGRCGCEEVVLGHPCAPAHAPPQAAGTCSRGLPLTSWVPEGTGLTARPHLQVRPSPAT